MDCVEYGSILFLGCYIAVSSVLIESELYKSIERVYSGLTGREKLNVSVPFSMVSNP